MGMVKTGIMLNGRQFRFTSIHFLPEGKALFTTVGLTFDLPMRTFSDYGRSRH
jgi:hypothetical protein